MVKINRNFAIGGLVLLVTFNIFNLINFIFQFAMVRMLSVTDYGILASLFSIVYIFLVFNDSIQLVITKYVAKESNIGKIKNLLKRSLKKSLALSSVVFVLYLIVSIFLSRFLKIDYLLLALNGIIIFSVFEAPVTRGVLQGKKRFFALGINMILDSSIKLICGLIFVYVGFRTYGAILAVILGSSIAFLASFISLRDIFKSKEQNMEVKGIYGYTIPAMIITLVVAMFYSLDVLVAKLVFSPEIAGFYAVAATLAKIIFLGTLPISKAMFPLSIENNENKNKQKSVIGNSFIFLVVCLLAVLTIFYFFPEFIIKIFSGKELKESASILFILGVSISITSITNLSLLYKLSKGKIKRYYLLPIFVLIELIILYYFSHNLLEFSTAFLFSSVIFLWGSNKILR